MTSEISDSEHFSRWVYMPRHINENGIINGSFIKLRAHINEEGISGQLFDRISKEIAIEDGSKFIRKDKCGLPKEKLAAIAIANIGDLRRLAQQPNNIDVLSVPSDYVREHAEIRIQLSGVPATGNTQNPLLSYYLELINDKLTAGLDWL